MSYRKSIKGLSPSIFAENGMTSSEKGIDRDRTRTCNPQIRSLVPYPLGHTVLLVHPTSLRTQSHQKKQAMLQSPRCGASPGRRSLSSPFSRQMALVLWLLRHLVIFCRTSLCRHKRQIHFSDITLEDLYCHWQDKRSQIHLK